LGSLQVVQDGPFVAWGGNGASPTRTGPEGLAGSPDRATMESEGLKK
jgi:hypothetical protein